MTDLNNKRANLIRIEFWAITTIFVFGLFFFLVDGFSDDDRAGNTPYEVFFNNAGVPFDYYNNYFTPVLLELLFQAGAFLALNFYIVPGLVRKEALIKNIALLVLVFICLGLIDGITDTYIHAYLYAGNTSTGDIFQKSFFTPVRSFLLFGIYTLLKYTGLYLITNSGNIEKKYRFVQRDGINAFVVWLISMFLLIVLEAEKELILAWGIIAPLGILLYCFSFYSLIPRSIGKRNGSVRYILKVALVLVIFIFPVFLLAMLSSHSEDTASIITSFNFAFQLFLTAPVSWILFKRRLKGNEEISGLQKELKQSTASIDFLRSQINPHFLFNALNTLYGTAIQEGADRTSEGIQKLGDMMRFMLQENMQDKISLSREIDYLHNYISLQRLRTDSSPTVQIQTSIQDRENIYQIAPMLLIPFVENAFKHGISFREPSHIKVTLEIKEGTLYFDVYNSKHNRSENDPEKDKSGIGLENVKQRLKLSYPKKHELIIRDTTKEFFIHLTVQLAKFA